MKSDEIGKLSAALSKAQGEIKNATKESENPYFKSKYADLASVWDACRGPLSRNELSIIQTIENEDADYTLRTTLSHSSGEWIESIFKLVLKTRDMQALGSAITYARRYSISAMVGIAQEDDDGNAASRGLDKNLATEAQKTEMRTILQQMQADKYMPDEKSKVKLKAAVAAANNESSVDHETARMFIDWLSAEYQGYLNKGAQGLSRKEFMDKSDEAALYEENK